MAISVCPPLDSTEFADARGDWPDFVKWATSLRGYVFRGQSEGRHSVTSSLARWKASQGETLSYADFTESDSDLLIDYDQYAEQIFVEIEERFDVYNPEQKIELWSVLQHHGFPTPLIDFSRSPSSKTICGRTSVPMDFPAARLIIQYQ